MVQINQPDPAGLNLDAPIQVIRHKSSLPKAADQQRQAVRYGGAQPVPQAIRFNTGWTGSWLARVGD